ncbi:MAG: hypothetical protein ACLT76_04325 [Clostridium fessum]
MYYAERTETFCIRSKQREAGSGWRSRSWAKLEETVKALKAEKKELAAEIRKAELSELLDAIEESNLA